jgi:hypothetical protein
MGLRQAYASDQRSSAIGPWIDDHNLKRPHAGIGVPHAGLA